MQCVAECAVQALLKLLKDWAPHSWERSFVFSRIDGIDKDFSSAFTVLHLQIGSTCYPWYNEPLIQSLWSDHMSIFSRSTKHIEISQIPHAEVYARAAAEFLDGNRDKSVSQRDIDKSKKLLEQHDQALAAGTPQKSPFVEANQSYNTDKIEALRKGLPVLEKLVGAVSEVRQRGPFFSELSSALLRDPQLQQSARLVAAAYDRGHDVLNYSDLSNAMQDIAAFNSGTLQQTKPEVYARLTQYTEKVASEHPGTSAADALKPLNAENLDLLHLFMATGKGGLIDHGPVRINGQSYNDVIPVPIDATNLSPEDLRKTIDTYDKSSVGSGYDRMYIQDENKRVYVVLSDKGSLDSIDANARVIMYCNQGQSEIFCDSAKLVAKFDEPNTFSEATAGFWLKQIKNTAGLFTTTAESAATKMVNQVAERVTDTLYSPTPQVNTAPAANAQAAATPDPEKKLNLQSAFAASAMMASAGVAFNQLSVDVYQLGIVSAVAFTAITATQAIRYLATPISKRPILEAAGAAINAPGRIRD